MRTFPYADEATEELGEGCRVRKMENDVGATVTAGDVAEPVKDGWLEAEEESVLVAAPAEGTPVAAAAEVALAEQLTVTVTVSAGLVTVTAGAVTVPITTSVEMDTLDALDAAGADADGEAVGNAFVDCNTERADAIGATGPVPVTTAEDAGREDELVDVCAGPYASAEDVGTMPPKEKLKLIGSVKADAIWRLLN